MKANSFYKMSWLMCQSTERWMIAFRAVKIGHCNQSVYTKDRTRFMRILLVVSRALPSHDNCEFSSVPCHQVLIHPNLRSQSWCSNERIQGCRFVKFPMDNCVWELQLGDTMRFSVTSNPRLVPIVFQGLILVSSTLFFDEVLVQ